MINLDPFTRVHPYETKEFIVNDILKHFQEVSEHRIGTSLLIMSSPLNGAMFLLKVTRAFVWMLSSRQDLKQVVFYSLFTSVYSPLRGGCIQLCMICTKLHDPNV